jgi:hypothetical protein
METVPNREKPFLLGKGTLLVSCPRNLTFCVETMLGREAETWSNGVEVGPPSNVTIRMKVITNPGRSFAAALGRAVPRWGSHPSLGVAPPRWGSHPLAGCEVI